MRTAAIAERFVLSSILLEPLLVEDAASRLGPGDFDDERHAVIFGAMLRVGPNRADFSELCECLEEDGELASAGGFSYLSSLDLEIPDLERFANHVEVVKERALRRRLASLLKEAGT